MSNINRRQFLGGAAALSALTLAACGGGSGTGDAGGETAVLDTLTVLSAVSNDNFNPFIQTNCDKVVMHALLDYLYKFDNDGNVVEMLAESYEEDGLDKLIKLREGVTFTDGSPLTADDVVYSWEQYLNDEVMATSMHNYIADIVKVDDLTIKVTPAHANILWQNALAEMVCIVKNGCIDESADYTATAPIGSGAYTLTSVDEARTVTLTANENYWGGAPAIKTVQVKTPVASSTALVSLQTPEVDLVCTMEDSVIPTAREDENLVVTDFPSWSQQMMGMLVGDEKFRQACLHAINPQNIIDICYEGVGEPATNVLSERIMGDYAGLVPFTGYDPDLAASCIAETETDLSKTYQLAFFSHSDVAQCIQQDLATIGVKVELAEMDANGFFDALLDGKLELFMAELGTDLQTCEDMLYLLFGDTSVYNYPVSDEFKAVVNSLPTLVEDDAKRAEAVKQALEMFDTEAPHVPIVDVSFHDVYRKGLTGVMDSSSATYVYYLGDMAWEA